MNGKAKLKHVDTLTGEFSVTREGDMHVCMSVEIGRDKIRSPRVFWRMMDYRDQRVIITDGGLGQSVVTDTQSLLEIGIDEESGQLASLDVVLYKGLLYPLGRELEKDLVISGLPCFCLDLWEKPHDIYDYGKYLYDVPGSFQLELGATSLRIRLYPSERKYGVTLSNQLTCEFNEHKELCAVLVSGLDSSEVQMLRDYSNKYISPSVNE